MQKDLSQLLGELRFPAFGLGGELQLRFGL